MNISDEELRDVYPYFIEGMKSAVKRGIYKSLDEIPGRYLEDEPDYADLLEKVVALYHSME